MASREALLDISIERKSRKKAIISSAVDGRAKDAKANCSNKIQNDPNSGKTPGIWRSGIGPSQKPSVIVVNPGGHVIEEFEIEHSALGWKSFGKTAT